MEMEDASAFKKKKKHPDDGPQRSKSPDKEELSKSPQRITSALGSKASMTFKKAVNAVNFSMSLGKTFDADSQTKAVFEEVKVKRTETGISSQSF